MAKIKKIKLSGTTYDLCDADALHAHQTIKQDGITGATVNRFGTCSIAAATAAKTVSITTGTFSLEAGAKVTVKFSYTNTANTPTLNVNSTGAKNIFYKGAQITTGANKGLLTGTVEFVYDGTQWQLIGPDVSYTPTYTATASTTLTGSSGTSNTKIATGSGAGDIYVPVATASSAGTTVVYPANSCTTFSSDAGTVTPLAVQKGAKMFAITRPPKKGTGEGDSSVTVNAIPRWEDESGDLKDSKILIEDVTNTKDSTKKAQVLSIPAEGGKKMVYGYCTDQVDGTSFIGGVFDANATEFPYASGLAIGGTSGNLLWKGKRVLDNDDLTTISKVGHTHGVSTADAAPHNHKHTLVVKGTTGANSGTAVAAVTGYSNFDGGSSSLSSDTTATKGIKYVEEVTHTPASLTGTTSFNTDAIKEVTLSASDTSTDGVKYVQEISGSAPSLTGTTSFVTGYGSFSGGSGSLKSYDASTGGNVKTSSGRVPYITDVTHTAATLTGDTTFVKTQGTFSAGTTPVQSATFTGDEVETDTSSGNAVTALTGVKISASSTAAPGGHTHAYDKTTGVTLTANDATATGRIQYVQSVSGGSGGLTSSDTTSGIKYVQEISGGSGSLTSDATTTTGIKYVESVGHTAATLTGTKTFNTDAIKSVTLSASDTSTDGPKYVQEITAGSGSLEAYDAVTNGTKKVGNGTRIPVITSLSKSGYTPAGTVSLVDGTAPSMNFDTGTNTDKPYIASISGGSAVSKTTKYMKFTPGTTPPDSAIFEGDEGTTGAASGNTAATTPTFSGTAVTSGAASATTTSSAGANTTTTATSGSTTPTFTGSEVTSGAASSETTSSAGANTSTTANSGSTTPTFTGSEVTSGAASATHTGSAGSTTATDNSGATTPTFTGKAVTSGAASTTTTSSAGGGTASQDTGATTPTFTGKAVTSGAASTTTTSSAGANTTTSDYTGTYAPAFTGVEVTSGAASAANTGSAGASSTSANTGSATTISTAAVASGVLTLTSASHTHTYYKPVAHSHTLAHTHKVTADGTVEEHGHNYYGPVNHTHTLAHTHSVTADGTVGSHSHTYTKPAAHTHTLAHTHSVTADGTVGEHTHTYIKPVNHSHTIAHTHSVTAAGTVSAHTHTYYKPVDHTHTLAHTHKVTAAGAVGAHTHTYYKPVDHTHTLAHTHSVTAAGTVSSHSHGLNSHTHSFIPGGDVTLEAGVAPSMNFNTGTTTDTPYVSSISGGSAVSATTKYMKFTAGTTPKASASFSGTNSTAVVTGGTTYYLAHGHTGAGATTKHMKATGTAASSATVGINGGGVIPVTKYLVHSHTGVSATTKYLHHTHTAASGTLKYLSAAPTNTSTASGANSGTNFSAATAVAADGTARVAPHEHLHRLTPTGSITLTRGTAPSLGAATNGTVGISGGSIAKTTYYLDHTHTAASLGTATTKSVGISGGSYTATTKYLKKTTTAASKASVGISGGSISPTTKYLHYSHTAATLGTADTTNVAPSGHTHSYGTDTALPTTLNTGDAVEAVIEVKPSVG